MKCKLPIKPIKMKEVMGGDLNLASLNCAFLPRACKYELQVIFYFEAALLHYIGRFFEESIFLNIGQSCDNSFDNNKR